MKGLTCLMLEGRFLSSMKKLVKKNVVLFANVAANHSPLVPVLRSHPQECCPTLHMQMEYSRIARDYLFDGLLLFVIISYLFPTIQL